VRARNPRRTHVRAAGTGQAHRRCANRGAYRRRYIRAAGAPTVAPTTAPAVKPTAPAGQPVAGGTLRATLGAEPTTLDPHKLGTLFDRDVSDAMFDALVDDDTLDGIKGALAESWDSPDARVWTFKLRSGVKFHDGSPLNAEAVKFSFDRLQEPNTGITGQIRPTASQVEAVDVVDPSTVKVALKTPSAAFPVDASNIKIIAKDFDTAKPVGTGHSNSVSGSAINACDSRRILTTS
jgi:ABC-type transport system substrate-binding protein